MRLTGAILLTLLLAALAGAGGAWMGARYVYQKHHAAHSLHELVHEKLDLTPEQERRLDALEQDFAVRRRAREAEMRAANAQLAAAMAATPVLIERPIVATPRGVRLGRPVEAVLDVLPPIL